MVAEAMLSHCTALDPYTLTNRSEFYDYTFARWRVTSVKRWKRDTQRLEVHAKFGLYKFASFNEHDLYLTGSDAVARKLRELIMRNELKQSEVLAYFNH